MFIYRIQLSSLGFNIQQQRDLKKLFRHVLVKEITYQQRVILEIVTIEPPKCDLFSSFIFGKNFEKFLLLMFRVADHIIRR